MKEEISLDSSHTISDDFGNLLYLSMHLGHWLCHGCWVTSDITRKSKQKPCL